MLFGRKKAFHQSPGDAWIRQWQSIVPPENRNVPITLDGRTEIAYVQINQFVMMIQDGLLMEAAFFDVCKFFQKAGYHVIWLMRCSQDIHNGYLKALRSKGSRKKWRWKSPTTNFGRWTTDNFEASILLQWQEYEGDDPLACEERILQRVVWAESDDDTRMIPGRTEFQTTDRPGTAAELLKWLRGAGLNSL
ncbi:MAG: hypothetical protein IJ453_05590 [Oscillospiraceae bacterium]|nr:hypothetical protein [Oscillospiraceae bacterium]